MTKLFDENGREVFLGDLVDTSTGESEAMHAASRGDVDELRRLRMRHADFNRQDNDGWTALLHACAAHQFASAEFLVSCGVNLEARAADGWTALMVAIDHGQLELVRLLVNAGAYIGTWTQQGFCELVIAMRSPQILELLLANGANPNLPHPRFPFMTPLLISMTGNPGPDPLSIKLLVRHGADVNARNDAGQTALMLSVYNARLTRALLECGADPKLADRDGETVRVYAAHRQADPATRFVLNEWGV